ncbi:MAG: histidine phosphatase family protein [Hyphomonadaceae bacterium]
MPRLYLIRHAEPAATWGGSDPNPGLSELGRAQAADASWKLAALKPKRIVTSPLMRCRETAAALEMEMGLTAAVDTRVSEIWTPEGVERRAWLQGVMSGAWSDYPSHDQWRADIRAALLAQDDDTAIFTHFVAINVIVGAIQGVAAATVFKPAHASITTLDVSGGDLRIAALGAETAAVSVL